MRNFYLGLLGILISVSASAQQVAKQITAKNGKTIAFYQYTPGDYAANPTAKYPVIIFLHGGGEKGDGTTKTLSTILLNGTPPKIIADGHPMKFTWAGKTESFIVLSPQLNWNEGWWPNWYVDELLAYAAANLQIDPNRIFLTGLSLGGGGTWSYSGATLENAKKFAAIGVSCGACSSPNYSYYAQANLPLWAFHAMDDKAVGYGCTVSAIDKLNALSPAVKPYLSIWPDGDHWIWGRVYSTDHYYQNPNIYEWFLGQNKALPVNKRPVPNAGGAQSITTAQGSVTLNAGGSSDQDGSIVRYIWRKVSGPGVGNISTPESTNGITTVTGLTQAGTYQYEVKVIDNRADWTFATVNVTVTTGGTPTNQNPVANAGSDVTVNLPAISATLSGTASNDPDGSISTYAWTKVSGPAAGTIVSAAAATTVVNSLAEGTYVFRLKVTDNKGATAQDDVTVIVKSSAVVIPKPPISNAGADQTITLPANSVTLNGTGSSDPNVNGAIKGYKWRYIAGPGSFTITNSTAATTTVTNLTEGTYSFELRVWGNTWEPKDDTVKIIVKGGTTAPKPVPPIVKAGDDQTITLPTNSVTLNGTGSFDPIVNGAVRGYKWRYIAGPGSFTITNADAGVTTVTNLAQGTYSFELRAWGNTWEPAHDTVKVTVKPPISDGGTGGTIKVANAGPDQRINLPLNAVTLNGSASSDPKGMIKGYEWTKIGGSWNYHIASPRASVTQVTGLAQGVYTFRLTVWDNNWVPISDTVTIAVGSGTTSPKGIANAGPDIAITLPANTCVLNGSASHDPAGAIRAWRWRYLTGPTQYTIANSATAITNLTNLKEGIYSFELTAWSSTWNPYSDTLLVVVSSVAQTAQVTTTQNYTIGTADAAEAKAGIVAEQLKVYPNPARDILTVQSTSNTNGTAVTQVYDASGRLLLRNSFQKTATVHQQTLPVNNFKPGVYTIEVVIDQNTRLQSRFLKQ